MARDFVDDLELLFGDLIRSDDEFCKELWSAMTNMDWTDDEGRPGYNIFGVSFRVAGGIIADIRGDGSYMDWYCSGPSGVVSERISKSMSSLGWKHAAI